MLLLATIGDIGPAAPDHTVQRAPRSHTRLQLGRKVQVRQSRVGASYDNASPPAEGNERGATGYQEDEHHASGSNDDQEYGHHLSSDDDVPPLAWHVSSGRSRAPKDRFHGSVLRHG